MCIATLEAFHVPAEQLCRSPEQQQLACSPTLTPKGVVGQSLVRRSGLELVATGGLRSIPIVAECAQYKYCGAR
jgi:hypothetical protein